MLWVSNRLYPLVKASCPDHPLLRETRREVLEELLDSRSALAWLASEPAIRFRVARRPLAVRRRRGSTRAAASALRFETPADALRGCTRGSSALPVAARP